MLANESIIVEILVLVKVSSKITKINRIRKKQMRPKPWNPPIDLSEKESKIVKLIKRAKLFTFLREIRHLLFDEEFQGELSKIYAEAVTGHPPVPPAQLALTLILQAYTKASDAEAIEALTMDRRWQLAVDCRGL